MPNPTEFGSKAGSGSFSENEEDNVNGIGLATRGFSNFLGGSIDTVEEITQALPFTTPLTGESDLPSSKESFKQAFEQLGIPVEDEEAQPESISDRALLRSGQAVGAIPSFLAGGKGLSIPLKAASRNAGKIGRLARSAGTKLDDLVTGAAKNPATTIAAESTAGATAGTAGGLADRITDDELAIAAAELAGGILSPTGLATRGIGGLGKKARNALSGEDNSKAFNRAARQAQADVADPQQAAQDATSAAEAGINPVVGTGEPALISRVRKAAQESGAADVDDFENSILQSTENAKLNTVQDIAEGAEQEDAAKFISKKVKQKLEDLDKQRKQALALAQDEIRKSSNRFSPLSEEEAPKRFAKFLREQERKAANTESQLYNSIPDDFNFGQLETAEETIKNLQDDIQQATFSRTELPSGTRTLQRKSAQAGQEETDDLAKLVDDVIGGNNNGVTARDIKDFRARLNKLRRTSSDRNRQRVISEIDNAIISDIADEGVDAANREVGEQILGAAQFSKALNKTFREGNVGKIVAGQAGRRQNTIQGSQSFQSVAGQSKPIEELDQALTASGTPFQNSEEAKQLIGAIDEAPDEIKDGLGDFVRARFFQSGAVSEIDGQPVLNPNAARKFLRSNQQILRRLPSRRKVDDNLADELSGLVNDGDSLERIKKLTDNPRRELKDPAMQAANKFLNQSAASNRRDSITGRFDNIINSNNPVVETQGLLQIANQDNTGLATKGLKAGFIQEVLNRSEQATVQGRGFNEPLQNAKIKKVATTLLTPDEQSKLRKNLQTMSRAIRANTEKRANRPPSRVIDDEPAKTKTRVIQVLALRLAGKARQFQEKLGLITPGNAGGSIGEAQIVGSEAKNLARNFGRDEAEKLFREAVLDDETGQQLSQLLNAEVTSPEAKGLFQRVLGIPKNIASNARAVGAFEVPIGQEAVEGNLNQEPVDR